MTDKPAHETPGTPEYNEAMVAKAEGRTYEPAAAAAPAEPAERPSWLPEGFNTPEELAAAYAALKQSTGDKPDDQSQTPPDPAATAGDAVEAAGLDMDALAAKVAANGQLDDSDYEALAKQGITRQVADSYIAGQQALAEAQVTRIHARVGGEETLSAMLTWAATGLPKAEAEAFNDVMNKGSEAAIMLALDGLKAKYTAAEGSQPALIGGQRGGTTNGGVFNSRQEVTAAMRDTRYGKDPAYTQSVIDKLARSNQF